MKLFIDLREDEPAETARYQLAITLPAKWLQQPVDRLLETYLSQYAKKFPDAALVKADWAVYVKDPSPFARSAWKKIANDAHMGDTFADRQELWLAKAMQPADVLAARSARTCKNYGCQKPFEEAENGPEACCHHVGAPVFHDTRKWWSCCEEHKVYDFDALFSVPGCARGPHSLTPPASETKASEAVREAAELAASRVQAAPPPKPAAATAPPPQPAVPAPPRPKAPVLPPGIARCKHAGCQKDYAVDANGPAACCFHSAAPVFHDGTKKWPCCRKSAWDFDEFMALTGCETGPHEPVV